jgi:flagellar motor component MotA
LERKDPGRTVGSRIIAVTRYFGSYSAQSEKEGVMAAMNTTKKYLMIPAWILLLAIVALGVVQSGRPSNLIDPSGFLFVLVGGIALAVISFSGAEIGRAFRNAMGASGNEADIRSSAHFWEAAGRGFWILGVVRSVLHLVMYLLAALRTQEFASVQLLIGEIAKYLLSPLYGILLAVICFIPCWKLIGKLQNRPPAHPGEQDRLSVGRTGWRFGVLFGYVLFFAVLVLSFLKIEISTELLIALKPAMFVVVGGAIALILFTRGTGTGPTPSSAFAAMGLFGCLIGEMQMLFGISEGAPGVGQVAGAFAFFISSCLTALFGMVLVSAPLEDRAIRTGRIASPSAFSRAAWYVFPLLALIFLVQMTFQLFALTTTPPR